MREVIRVSRFVELSHPIVAGMITYPGLPAPEITTYLDREESTRRLTGGVSFHIRRIAMVADTGTYLDAPYHFHADGPDVSAVPLERVADVPIVSPGEDADPAGQRPDDLLHRERQPGRGEAEDNPDPPGERPPHHGECDQQHDDDQGVDGLAQVVPRVGIIGAAADQPPGHRGHQERKDDQGGRRYQPPQHARVVAQQLEESAHGVRPPG